MDDKKFCSSGMIVLSSNKPFKRQRSDSSISGKVYPANPNMKKFSELIQTTGGQLSTVVRWRAKLRAKTKMHRAVKKLRFLGRLAILCYRLCKYSHESVDSSKAEFLSVIQISEEFAKVEREGPYFDPREFKADKVIRLPKEARKILNDPPEIRTVKDIKYLQIVLRTIKAFAEYPRQMQRRLCQVGWYENYEPKRAIVRQGHPPQAFYFILSGTVIVTAFDRDHGGTKLLVRLYEGMSFGELAVITKSRRQATVSTQTPTELLCISALDFEEIFMSGGVHNIVSPDKNSFIRNIGFLQNWPIHLLTQNPQSCMFHYFNRGQVLVRDSNKSDWIYIVKSGSLTVLKKLKAVEPIKDKHSDDISDLDSGSARLHDGTGIQRSKSLHMYRDRDRRKRERLKRQRPRSLDSGPEFYKNNRELEQRLERTLPGFHNTNDRLGCINYDKIIKQHKSRLLQKVSSVDVLPRLEENRKQQEVKDNDNDKENDQEDTVKLPQIRKTSKGAYLSSSQSRRSRRSSTKEENIKEKLARKQMEMMRKMASQEEGRKTIAEELDNKPLDPSTFTLTEADLNPSFVVVQVLEAGQYFGLSSELYRDQPSMSLISNGSECVMISKKFFMQNATEKTMRYMYQTECPFPSEESLQTGLQSYINWEAHRKKIYDRIVRGLDEKRQKRKSFLRQYQGEYCFRTGPL